MNAIFKKLNYKNQAQVHVIHAPDSFRPVLHEMQDFTAVVESVDANTPAEFILTFCKQQTEVDTIAEIAEKALQGDGILWIAYPKGTSKKYKCDFNRDTGWTALGSAGFEPVRQVAIDEDWSALWFRKVEYIKKMTRSFAMTEEGKIKAGK